MFHFWKMLAFARRKEISCICATEVLIYNTLLSYYLIYYLFNKEKGKMLMQNKKDTVYMLYLMYYIYNK